MYVCRIAVTLKEITGSSSSRRSLDEYFDQVYFPQSPTAGTLAGYHQYDTQLEDFSRKNIDAEIAALHRFEHRVAAIHRMTRWRFLPRSDREMVLGNIHSRLLTSKLSAPGRRMPTTIRAPAPTAHSPSWSANLRRLTIGCVPHRPRKADARVACRRARESQNPPRIFTEIAIEQLPGIVSFFQHDVPRLSPTQRSRAQSGIRTDQRRRHLRAEDYLAWLKTDLLPRSNGEFRIGAETFTKKLEYDEMVDLPLDKLLEIGWADMRKNQEHFRQVAKELEPGQGPAAKCSKN